VKQAYWISLIIYLIGCFIFTFATYYASQFAVLIKPFYFYICDLLYEPICCSYKANNS